VTLSSDFIEASPFLGQLSPDFTDCSDDASFNPEPTATAFEE
jgi:hypothetical protein